ncbi:hypothetical protein F0726_00052 [Acidithiobacillus caldus]|nr:hypothetical protein F0726_00052 [Acidithiobacillus caldus]
MGRNTTTFCPCVSAVNGTETSSACPLANSGVETAAPQAIQKIVKNNL